MYKLLGIIPPGLSIKKDINTGHMENSNAKWNELLKRQSFEILDFLLHEYDEKFIKILDSICELKDRIYEGCEDLDEASSIFEKLSKAKEKYIECIELRLAFLLRIPITHKNHLNCLTVTISL